ncbi:hypothetical protein PHMEG_0003146 [Phytophthora megakarya]|uniref:Uncharacterized protein n=1 Tax=Phytophthora megakarya TaxID=4795 RepID=A0A225WYS2_9STRA|nr:hypothetical protein PHMEG_0003146 [Phytophthora megakarya]
MALDKYIRFMEENASEFWHGGHWFAIDASTQGRAIHKFLGGRILDAAIETMLLDSHEPKIIQQSWQSVFAGRTARHHGSSQANAGAVGHRDQR